MPITYQKQLGEQTSFALWKIEESADELYSQLQFKKHELDYLKLLNHDKRNLHWLSTRVLLRKLLNTDAYIDCRADAHGKPYLVNLPYHISLSHSYEYAAVIISKEGEVGIDIELIKDKIKRVAKKFMSPQELAFIDLDVETEQLYACWCAKEAVYKLNGKKNVSFLQQIHLMPFAYKAKQPISIQLHQESLTPRSFTVDYEKLKDYMIGYVVDRQ